MMCLPVPAWFYGVGGFVVWSLIVLLAGMLAGNYLTVRER